MLKWESTLLLAFDGFDGSASVKLSVLDHSASFLEAENEHCDIFTMHRRVLEVTFVPTDHCGARVRQAWGPDLHNVSMLSGT